jgi:hypothetical protein
MVACGGPQWSVVACDGPWLRWPVVACSGLWWSVVSCGGLWRLVVAHGGVLFLCGQAFLYAMSYFIIGTHSHCVHVISWLVLARVGPCWPMLARVGSGYMHWLTLVNAFEHG